MSAREAHEAAAKRHAELEAARKETDGHLADARTKAEASAGKATAALADAGFADATTARDAVLDADALTALEEAIAAHDERIHSATDRQRRAREAVGKGTRPDLESATAAVEAAEGAARAAATARDTLAAVLGRAAKQIETIRVAADAVASQERAYGVLGGLARVANGDNPAKLSLHRYVLAALLDEVLVTASQRLLQMSRGRFHLRRSTDATDRRRVSGLDLEVQDEHTGRARPAHTLSGGEGFLAALALALATAEVVRHHAGGIHLDALFVDEGFGSLDADALDEAVSTLQALGEGGRIEKQ